MLKRTSHTILAKITSHGSGGRAEMLMGNEYVHTNSSSGKHLTSAKFKDFDVDTFVVVRILLSPKRRIIQRVTVDEKVLAPSEFEARLKFIGAYGDVLKKENEHFAELFPELETGFLFGIAPSTEIAQDVEVISHSNYETSTQVDEKTSVNKVPVSVKNNSQELQFNYMVKSDPKIYINETTRELFNSVLYLTKNKHYSVLMVGASGYGKTSLAEQVAYDNDMLYFRLDCPTVADVEELFGYRAADGGSTLDENGNPIFILSEFSKVLAKGNAIIVLDELSRMEQFIANALLPLLDHAGRTVVLGREFVVGPNILFVGTANIGYEFTGTYMLDSALVNRFSSTVLVSAMPEEEEARILSERTGLRRKYSESIVSVATILRNLSKEGKISTDVSTRKTFHVAELVCAGMSVGKAYNFCVMNNCEPEEAKLIADTISDAALSLV